jgi:CDGSH-type Zn-finger protein
MQQEKFSPVCAGTSPAKIELEAGKTYAFCPCGLSATQPLCDGAHKTADTGGMKSLKFSAIKSGTYWLCMCKQSKTIPFCDGSHSKITA